VGFVPKERVGRYLNKISKQKRQEQSKTRQENLKVSWLCEIPLKVV
jgi:hypothetical protein